MLLISALCLMILVLIFLYAAVQKAFSFTTFAATLELSFHVPSALSRGVAGMIVMAELVLSVSLLLASELLWLRWLTLALMAGFALLPLYALLSQREIQCGCFGETSTLGWHELIRNTFLLCCSLVVIYAPPALPANSTLVILTLLAFSIVITLINLKPITYFIKAQ